MKSFVTEPYEILQQILASEEEAAFKEKKDATKSGLCSPSKGIVSSLSKRGLLNDSLLEKEAY